MECSLNALPPDQREELLYFLAVVPSEQLQFHNAGDQVHVGWSPPSNRAQAYLTPNGTLDMARIQRMNGLHTSLLKEHLELLVNCMDDHNEDPPHNDAYLEEPPPPVAERQENPTGMVDVIEGYPGQMVQTVSNDSLDAVPTKSPKWLMRLLDDMFSLRLKAFQFEVETNTCFHSRNVVQYATSGSSPDNQLFEDFSSFVFHYLAKKFGLEPIVKKMGAELLTGVKYWRGHLIEVEVFGLFLSSEKYNTIDLMFYLGCRSAILAHCVTRTEPIIIRTSPHPVTRRYFPVKNVLPTCRKLLRHQPLLFQYIKQRFYPWLQNNPLADLPGTGSGGKPRVSRKRTSLGRTDPDEDCEEYSNKSMLVTNLLVFLLLSFKSWRRVTHTADECDVEDSHVPLESDGEDVEGNNLMGATMAHPPVPGPVPPALIDPTPTPPPHDEAPPPVPAPVALNGANLFALGGGAPELHNSPQPDMRPVEETSSMPPQQYSLCDTDDALEHMLRHPPPTIDDNNDVCGNTTLSFSDVQPVDQPSLEDAGSSDSGPHSHDLFLEQQQRRTRHLAELLQRQQFANHADDSSASGEADVAAVPSPPHTLVSSPFAPSSGRGGVPLPHAHPPPLQPWEDSIINNDNSGTVGTTYTTTATIDLIERLDGSLTERPSSVSAPPYTSLTSSAPSPPAPPLPTPTASTPLAAMINALGTPRGQSGPGNAGATQPVAPVSLVDPARLSCSSAGTDDGTASYQPSEAPDADGATQSNPTEESRSIERDILILERQLTEAGEKLRDFQKRHRPEPDQMPVEQMPDCISV